jgi:predicted MFS family arabinose efflux permease
MPNRWAVLLLLCLARVSVGLHLQAVAALSPFLIADLGLSYAELGTLIGLFLLPGVFIALPGGLVSGRLGDRATLLGALGLLTVGSGLLAVSSSLEIAVVARLLSGAGGVLVTMQVAKMTADWFAGKEIATALGLMLATFPLGIAVAMATLGGLASATDWRTAVAAAAAATGSVLALVALLYRDPARPGLLRGAPRPPLWVITPPELRLVLVAGAAFAVLNAAWVVFVSFTPTLLIARGLPAPAAAVLVSWASWCSIGAIVVAGYALDRLARPTRWIAFAAVVTAATCLAASLWEPALLWIVLFGIASAPTAVGVLALPSAVLNADSRRTGFGIFFTVNYVGFAALPALAGYLLDVTGSELAPLWLSGLLWLTLVASLALFRWLQGRTGRPADRRLHVEPPAVLVRSA